MYVRLTAATCRPLSHPAAAMQAHFVVIFIPSALVLSIGLTLTNCVHFAHNGPKLGLSYPIHRKE